jgi:hypothetical protein
MPRHGTNNYIGLTEVEFENEDLCIIMVVDMTGTGTI